MGASPCGLIQVCQVLNICVFVNRHSLFCFSHSRILIIVHRVINQEKDREFCSLCMKITASLKYVVDHCSWEIDIQKTQSIIVRGEIYL